MSWWRERGSPPPSCCLSSNYGWMHIPTALMCRFHMKNKEQICRAKTASKADMKYGEWYNVCQARLAFIITLPFNLGEPGWTYVALSSYCVILLLQVAKEQYRSWSPLLNHCSKMQHPHISHWLSFIKNNYSVFSIMYSLDTIPAAISD